MSDDEIRYSTISRSTEVSGRTITSARNNHLVIDSPSGPNEAITTGEAFAAGIAAYGRAGFDRDEWRRHHQGGAAGYAGRDPRGTPAVTDPVQVDQAFAWNPTAAGAKVEDTVLVRADGIEVLTVDPRWPTTRVAGRDRPIELDRVRLG